MFLDSSLLHRIGLVTGIVAALAGGAREADAHDHPLSQTNIVQIPSGPVSGAYAIGGIGPPVGVAWVHANVNVTFTSAGTFRASDLLVEVSTVIDGIQKEWHVSGADLGFGTAPGTYSGSIGTDSMNGVVSGLPGAPFSFLDIHVLAVNGPIVGSFSNSFLSFEWNTTLIGTPASLSLATGGQQALAIDFGPAYAGRAYLVLGSLTGTAPGTAVAGVPVPLNADPYFLLTATAPNSVFLQNGGGTLNAQGRAQATFFLPGGAPPSVIGLTLNHAVIVADAAGTSAAQASIAQSVELAP